VADTRPATSPAQTPAALPPPPQGPSAPNATVKDRTSRPAAPPPASREPRLARVPEDRVIRAASIDTLNAVDTTVAGGSPTVEPLPSIDPISIATLGVPGTSTATIAINPITVDQIDITPLAPRR
jgi:hypothetical protein